MPLTLNGQLGKLQLSGIRRFNQMARQTPGCISLTLGEPGEDTPAGIRAKVPEDLGAGLTHYPPNNGYPWLREGVAAFERAHGVPGQIAAADNVIVTAGATEALFVALSLVLNPGDEVIIPSPAFSLYESITTLQRGVPVLMDTIPYGFQIDAHVLSAHVTEKTKAIVLNSPNNPTGCVLDDASLDAVARVAAKHDLFVICDDVYSELVYVDGYERFCQRHPELADRMLVVGSFSKPWAMTGWRLGWLECAAELAREASKIHQYMVSSVPAFLQHAALEALGTDTARMRRDYQARRDLTLGRLAQMGLSCEQPGGAFYAFPRVSELGLNSEAFCEQAIREAGVALVPGSCFGGRSGTGPWSRANGFVRLSYACAPDVLEEGLTRLARFVESQGDGLA
jgi:aspartate/methionine/tyrosine aminotransferase